jgi:hypothetical protein
MPESSGLIAAVREEFATVLDTPTRLHTNITNVSGVGVIVLVGMVDHDGCRSGKLLGFIGLGGVMASSRWAIFTDHGNGRRRDVMR